MSNRIGQESNMIQKFPVKLYRVLMDYETKQQEALKDPDYDVYQDLGHLLNLHPKTIRSYTNKFNPSFPPVNTLVAICRITGDYSLINFLQRLK